MERRRIRRLVTIINGHPVKKYYMSQQPWAVEVLKRDNFICVDCKGTESLVVHHLDESRKNGVQSMNNNLENLISLCRSCHARRHGQHLKFSRVDKSLILDLRNQGKTYQEIATYVGLSRQRIHQIVAKLV